MGGAENAALHGLGFRHVIHTRQRRINIPAYGNAIGIVDTEPQGLKARNIPCNAPDISGFQPLFLREICFLGR